jgi:hypothetical protein
MSHPHLDAPVYCVTSDFDWASDFCLDELVGFLADRDIVPTVFATHRSEALGRHAAAGLVDVGLHPNFLPGSSHGDDAPAVIDHMLELFPEARSWRSHCFVDSTPIAREMLARGLRYDSNLCLYLQPDLVPLRHGTGTVRLPVFWEDDCHWDLSGSDWDVASVFDRFLTPGLKILNVHPFMFAANVTSTDHYLRVKPHITTLDARDLDAVAHRGPGTRTFMTELVDALHERGAQFMKLEEIYRMTVSEGSVR